MHLASKLKSRTRSNIAVAKSDPTLDDKPLAGKKVAVLVETEFIHEELEYYAKHVPELGGEITFLAHLWGKPSLDLVNDIDSPDRPITTVHRLTVTQCVTQANPNEYDVVICAANYVAVRLREIPPMGSLGSPAFTASAPAVEFFARAMENRKIIKAAMCHALWILTPRHDLLKGRKVICHTVVLADIHNAGAVYIPDPSHVVVDDDLVTARSFADVVPYFQAIVQTVASLPPDGRSWPLPSTGETLNQTAEGISSALASRFAGIAVGTTGAPRPVAAAARALLKGTLSTAREVKRMIGVDFDATCAGHHRPILLVASKFGTWASEVTVVAATLLQAGYRVKIATEDGSPPHLLGPSLDPTFNDGAWRCSVVSPEEQHLAFRFLEPGTAENALLQPANILDLSRVAKPPQAGDYLKDRSLLDTYRTSLRKSLELASDFDAMIIAGGSGAVPGLMADRGLHSLILAFDRLRKPIMAECNGGLAVAQTIDPATGKSILAGRAVTTHSWLDEYQSGWGWTKAFAQDTDNFWTDGNFDLPAYQQAELWDQPGVGGNPLIDSEALFRNAAGPDGIFFSPAGSPYSVVVDENLITCRTTPDGYPGVLSLMAILDGRPQLRGRLFIDGDRRGRRQPAANSGGPFSDALNAARRGDIDMLVCWLEAGGDPDAADEDGWTPLLAAAAHGQAKVVDFLLHHELNGVRHANPERRFPGADALPIYMAGQSGDLPTVQILLRERPGHLFDVATVNGHTILLQAAFYGQKPHQRLAAYLLNNVHEILSIPADDGAAIAAARHRMLTATNVRGQNPIALAQAYDIRPMVALLKTFDQPTEDECDAYCRRLLRRIAPPLPRDRDQMREQDATNHLIDAIQKAIDQAGEPVSGGDGASEEDAKAFAEIENRLNEERLQINRLGGPLQRTPLIVACTGADGAARVRDMRDKIVDRLLKQGADPLIHEVHAMGVNAVVRAAVWGHLYLLERFLKVPRVTREVFTEALNEKPLVNGFTALHDSVLRALSAQEQQLDDYLKQIRWLIKHGARTDIEDHTGRTQEEIARSALSDPDFRDNARKVMRALSHKAH